MESGMRELIRTNDFVLLSFVEALLRDSKIAAVVADQNMSVMEGSIGILPRRLLVDEDSWPQAKRLLEEADLGRWISRQGEE
jgi:putative signal transducing protein